jgi:hypothetical protein
VLYLIPQSITTASVTPSCQFFYYIAFYDWPAKNSVQINANFHPKEKHWLQATYLILQFPVTISGYYLQTPAKIIGFGLEDCKLKEFQPPESAGQREPSPNKHTMQDGGCVDGKHFYIVLLSYGSNHGD